MQHLTGLSRNLVITFGGVEETEDGETVATNRISVIKKDGLCPRELHHLELPFPICRHKVIHNQRTEEIILCGGLWFEDGMNLTISGDLCEATGFDLEESDLDLLLDMDAEDVESWIKNERCLVWKEGYTEFKRVETMTLPHLDFDVRHGIDFEFQVITRQKCQERKMP